jgi:hypothetical protein
VGFGGEVEDAVDLVFAEEFGDEAGVADIAVGEGVSRIALDGGEVFGISGVSEFVEVNDFIDGESVFLGGIAEEVMDEVGADKAGAAGDEEIHLLEFWEVG